MQYRLCVTIMLDGMLLFASTERLDPFKQPEGSIVIRPSIVGTATGQQQAVQPSEADAGLAVESINLSAERTNTYWKLVSLHENDMVMAEGQDR